MTTEREIDALAATLADLSEDEEAALQVSLLAIKAERARAEEKRLDRLRAMTDFQVVDFIIRSAHPDPKLSVRVLRDAGFVRGVTLQAAYRAGYERYGHEHLGNGHPLQDEDDYDYVRGRDYDLRELAKDDDVPGYILNGA